MSVHSDLGRIITSDLTDCEQALKRNDPQKALRALHDAVKKLKDIVPKVSRLERKPAQG